MKNQGRPFEQGEIVGGRYEITKKLTTGGMAEIYIARIRASQGFEKYVVLKRILPQFSEDDSFVKMFLNEARVAATLSHPNIGSVHDFGESEGGYFYTMEYLHGEDLRRVLKTTVNKNIEFPQELVLTVGISVAAALDYAHEKRASDGRFLKIVHRDVSPSNIIVTYDGGVKLVDFGIAKAATQTELTGAGVVKGKSGYMSPEQLRGEKVDGRSDVFSLGVVLYELSTQRRLFRAESEVASMRMILGNFRPRPTETIPGYPQRLEEIILKSLKVEPIERHQSARELEIELEEFGQQSGIVVSPAKLGEWMGSVFGQKPEPWFSNEEEPRTKVIPLDDLDSPPPMLPWGPDPMKKSWTKPLLLIGVLAMIAFLVGFIGVRNIPKIFRDDSPEPAITHVTVVTQGNVVDGSEGPKPPPSKTEEKIEPALAKKASKKPTEKASISQKLTRAFGENQGQIQKCLRDFTDRKEETHVQIRFKVEKGAVAEAKMLPPAGMTIADMKPLSTCLEAVALKTRFPVEPALMVFTIPITVKRTDRPF